jgi:uncharacterized protein YndB with AHSA1/START domain
MEPMTIERDIWIAAPVERVWRAVTDPAQIGKWWPPDAWTISALEVGGEVRFGPPDDYSTATIEALDKPVSFAMRWHPNEAYSLPEMRTFITLTPENDGTRLTISETGYENVPEAMRSKRFESSSKGYTLVLKDLKAYLEAE